MNKDLARADIFVIDNAELVHISGHTRTDLVDITGEVGVVGRLVRRGVNDVDRGHHGDDEKEDDCPGDLKRRPAKAGLLGLAFFVFISGFIGLSPGFFSALNRLGDLLLDFAFDLFLGRRFFLRGGCFGLIAHFFAGDRARVRNTRVDLTEVRGGDACRAASENPAMCAAIFSMRWGCLPKSTANCSTMGRLLA